MSSLKNLFLSDCSNIERVPDFGKSMKSILMLNLMNCRNLHSIPKSITNLKSLKILNISGCSKVCHLPKNINQNKALEDLDLSRTSIRELDPSLLQLQNLKRLSFRGCSGTPSNSIFHLPFGLKFKLSPAHTALILPPFVSGLSSLTVLDLSYCNLTDASIPHDLDCLSSLERLILSGNNFIHLPAYCFAKLSKLRSLELEDCLQLQSLPVLPPHVRLYSKDPAQGEDSLLDVEMLWKLFEASDKELSSSPESQMFIDWPQPSYLEIPPRLDNRSFFPLGSFVSKLDSIASLTIDIPDDCRSSDCWGVAVVVVFEAQEAYVDKYVGLYWSFEASDPETAPSLCLASGLTANNDRYLLTMLVSGDYIYLRRHHRRDFMSENNKFSRHRKPDLSENSKLRVELRVVGREIRKCEWRVLREEDLEALQKGRKTHVVEIP